jgi:hypothetical protein
MATDKSCPFYGKNGMFGRLIDQGGNQCGIIFRSYPPCQMEVAGLRPDFAACVLGDVVREGLGIPLWAADKPEPLKQLPGTSEPEEPPTDQPNNKGGDE